MQVSQEQATSAVLIVEGEALLRLDLVEAFEKSGLQVFACSEAEEALALLSEKPSIGLVVTDIRMHGAMDGVSLAQHAKTSLGKKVIFVTGTLRAQQLAWADASFIKPVDPAEVLSRAMDLLAR